MMPAAEYCIHLIMHHSELSVAYTVFIASKWYFVINEMNLFECLIFTSCASVSMQIIVFLQA